MRFTKIPEDTFKELQLNAGVLLSEFEEDMDEAAVLGSIIGATSGGTSFEATPTYSDYGEDIDNCPKNVKELKKLDSWEVTMTGSFVTVNLASAKRLIGAADVEDGKVTPRNDVNLDDFEDIWWVGDYSSENEDETGGYVAIHMLNSLSTGGFKLTSDDRAKGKFDFEFTGHYSIENQDQVPFEVYIQDGEESNDGDNGGDGGNTGDTEPAG